LLERVGAVISRSLKRAHPPPLRFKLIAVKYGLKRWRFRPRIIRARHRYSREYGIFYLSKIKVKSLKKQFIYNPLFKIKIQ
jgi:hypothetical protein